MQTRTYGDLFKLVQSLAGVTAFSDNEQDDIANLINRRYQAAFNTSPIWPRYLVQSEERNVAVFKVSGYNNSDYNGLFYKLGDDSNENPIYAQMGTVSTGARADAQIYQFNAGAKTWSFGGVSWDKNLETGVVSILSGVTLNTQRDTSIEYENPWDVIWTNPIGSLVKVEKVQTIPYDDVGEAYESSDPAISRTTIGEFIRIHRKDAFLNNSALEYDFYANEDGAHILNISNTGDTSVFVTYKKKFTPFTTSSSYTTSTEEVPGEFFQYIAYGTYADFLCMDGQHDKAQLEAGNAELSLAQQLERVDAIMNNNTINKKFISNTYFRRYFNEDAYCKLFCSSTYR